MSGKKSLLTKTEARCLDLLDLPSSAKKLYYVMVGLGQSGACYARKKTLAERAGTSERQVRRLVAMLKQAGLLKEHPRKYCTSVYTFPEIPEPEFKKDMVRRMSARCPARVQGDVQGDVRSMSYIKTIPPTGGSTPGGGTEVGGKETLPKSSPLAMGGGLSVRSAHEEEDARCARATDGNAHQGKVVPIHPYDRLREKVAALDGQYDPQGSRQWLRDNGMERTVKRLEEIAHLIQRLADMGYGPNSDCLEKVLSMRLSLIDRSSITIANNAVRALHRAITKDYQKTHRKEKVGDENEHGESDEFDYEEAKEV